jgi:hypothetical protein
VYTRSALLACGCNSIRTASTSTQNPFASGRADLNECDGSTVSYDESRQHLSTLARPRSTVRPRPCC